MLTEIQISKLPNPAKRRELADGKVTGLYFVVQPSGARSWAVRYRADGKPAKLTLGPFPAVGLAEARRRAREELGKIAGGEDPASTKRTAREAARAAAAAESDRVSAVAAEFVKRAVTKRTGHRRISDSWAAERERLLRVEVLPKIGRKRIGDVTKTDIIGLLEGMVDRGSAVNANRLLAVLRRMFNWCISRGLVDKSPCDRLTPPAPETSRDRVLSDDEIRLVWKAFGRVGYPFGPMAQLLLLTGARLNEIASGRWNEIDLEAKTWTVSRERSKNGVAHELPLSDAAIGILKSLPRIGDRKDALVFSTTGRTPVSGFSNAKEAIDRTMVEARGADAEAIPHWVFHDLRRSAASGMAGIGIAPHVVEAALGHRSGTIKGVAAVYNRYSYATEQRQALDAWSRRLDSIISGVTGDNVVALAKARA
jgi:integrase